MVEENESIITRSMVISGSVESHGRVVLEGSLEGSFLGRDLDIRLGGRIFGEIKAINIDCAGHMEGSVVTDSFALRRSGRHVGTVQTRKLTVEPGAILDCALQSGAPIGPTAAPLAGKAMSGSTLDLEPFLAAFREDVRPCCMDVPWSERLELYSRLLGLLEKDKPLIKVTGESGSGKSVLVEKIRQTLPESYRIVKLLDQTASVAAILQEVAEHLAVEGSMQLSQEELLAELKDALLEKRRCGLRVVLLIDDAEKMFPATMEGVIRTLTDACGDGPRQELLQLVLFGTKEMETKMVSTVIEYFEDETNCQLYLEPLNIKDTADYLRFSLQLVAAGGTNNYSTALLPYETIRKIHSLSHGNIAAINRLADRALRRAHADGAPEISSKYL